MFTRATTISVGIGGIVSATGLGCGIAPGFLLNTYPLLGLGAGISVFIVILLIIAAVLYQYQQIDDDHQSTNEVNDEIFHRKFTKREKNLLIFTIVLISATGFVLGIFCELLLKSIQATWAVQIILVGILLFIILVSLIVLLVIGSFFWEETSVMKIESKPVIIEPIPPRPVEEPRIKTQEGPQNLAARLNRYRPTSSSRTAKPLPTIQKEYQRLVYPSSRLAVNDKVYVDDKYLAQIIESDGVGNYRIQYDDNGEMDFKNGSALRKALPLLS